MDKKTIIITGGTSGIGLACADHLIKKNYRVIITGRNKNKLEDSLKTLGPYAEGYLVDAGDLDQITQWVNDLKNGGIKIDGLFINAGVFTAIDLESTTEEIFDQTMNINFKGPYFTIQRMLPLLKNPSSIVLNTSIVVFKGFPNTSVYTSSKAALESLARVLNLELANRGIRINIISPGVTQTPILEKAGMSAEAVDELMKNLESSLPIRRPVQPTDIAPVLAFLVSEDSLVLRNEKIIVDGGSTL